MALTKHQSAPPDQGDMAVEEIQGDVSEAPDQDDASVDASQPDVAQYNAETANG